MKYKNQRSICSVGTLLHLSVRAAILCTVLSFPICAADEMLTGEKLYAQGDFAGALRCFKDEARLNPMSANVHYNLANCYVATKNYSEAQKEYRIVIALYPTSKEAEYSNVALDRLFAVVRSPHTLTSTPRSAPNQIEQQANPASDDLKRSVSTVSIQTNERAQQKINEAERRAKEILDQAEEACKPIKAEQLQVVDDLRQPIYVKSGVRYRSEAEINAAKAPYDNQMTQVRAVAAKRAQEVIQEGKLEASYIEESALDLDKSLIHANPNAPRMVPNGTGLFIRNYVTPDSPTGNPMPLIASPKKLPAAKSK